MSFSEWSNNKIRKKKAEALQPTVYEAPSENTGSTVSSFADWSNNKKASAASKSVQDWVQSSQSLLEEVQLHYSSWKNDNDQYNSFQDRASNLLSLADGWRKQYSQNTEAIKSIDSVVSSLSGMKQYAMKYNDYYSKWDSENAYKKAVEQAEADKERWSELTGGYDPIKNKEEGKTGWKAYVADKEQSTQRAAEAEAKRAAEGYSWKQFWDDLGRWMGPGVNPDTSLPFHTDVQLIAQGYRDEEAAKRVPDERWTEDQRYTYGYLWEESRQKAAEYAFAVNNMLNIQKEQEQLKQIMEWSTANFGTGAANTVGAIATAPAGLADFLGDVIQFGTLGYIPEADGTITPFEFSQGVTSGISQHLNTEYGTLNEGIPIIGGKGWGDVYGLGTSIAQSSLAAATGGPGQALITFFGSAAAAGVDDAVSRGASADQAVAYGTMVGLAEALAEMIGVDNLMKIGSSATIKQLVWNILKQGAAEGIEEGVTSVLNNFADSLIMGDKSNFNILVSEYMNQGLDKKDAKKKAWMNMAGDIAFDMLGGFVSGEVHAGPLTSISYVKTKNQYAKTGSSIMDADGGVEALMNLANEVAGVSSTEMQNTLKSQIDKVSQKPTARNVGQLYTTVQAANNQANAAVNQTNTVANPANVSVNQANTVANQADVAKSLRNKGISSKKVDGIAEAIVARLNGQELTRPQRNLLSSALNSPTVQSVISDIMKNRNSTVNRHNLVRKYREFSEATVLPEQYEGLEKTGFAREYGKAVEKTMQIQDVAKMAQADSSNDWSQTVTCVVTKEEQKELIAYADERGIKIPDLRSFDGDPELLRSTIDALSNIKNMLPIGRKVTLSVSHLLHDDNFGETVGDHITLNTKALRDRVITEQNIATAGIFASHKLEDIVVHEYGHSLATIKCSKGLEIARRAKYNITGSDTSLDEIIRYLRKGISAYSITFPSKNNTPRYFDVRKYREVIPEILAKHNCTPDDFTSEFVRLLKELL